MAQAIYIDDYKKFRRVRSYMKHINKINMLCKHRPSNKSYYEMLYTYYDANFITMLIIPDKMYIKQFKHLKYLMYYDAYASINYFIIDESMYILANIKSIGNHEKLTVTKNMLHEIHEHFTGFRGYNIVKMVFNDVILVD